jgi:hypothetical protein
LGRRSRKRSALGETGAGAPASPGATVKPPSRSEQKNAEARARLVPLAPGERPGAVTVAAVVAAIVALANPIAYAAGLQIRGQQPAIGGILVLSLIMGACALGLWFARYWAVLGFEAFLGLTIVYAAVSLMVAATIKAAVLCVAIIGLGGLLFWKLVRAMARIQMPERRPSP